MPSKSSAWFFVKFLAAAGALFWLWSRAGAADVYGALVLAAVRRLSPLLTGYDLESDQGGMAFVFGETRLALPLNLRETCAGVVPFLCLVLATADRSLAARARAIGAGLALLYSAQVAVVALTPLMMTPHREWVSHALDVIYTFAALAGLVALPLFLWWIWWRVTRPE